MSSVREEREKRRLSRDAQIENIKLRSSPTISTEGRHVPNYMRPTISSTLSQKHPSISSSAKEDLIRKLFDKSSSPCPRMSRRMSLSFDHMPLSPSVPCSPRKSRNQQHSNSKVSSLHNKKPSGNGKGSVPTILRTSSCIDFNKATVSTMQETRIEDHHDRVVEDNEHVVVVEANRCDYDSDKIFDEVQAMVLEDYNLNNEILPEIVEENMEHIVDIPKDNHDHKGDEHDIDTVSSNEIHDDIEDSNEVHPLVFDENKVHIENVQLDSHELSYEEEKEQDGYNRVEMVEDVDEEIITMVQADNRDQPSNCEEQDGVENSREILSTMAKEGDQPYHHVKQAECHQVEVENEKDDKEEDGYHRVEMVEDVDEENITMVQADNRYQPSSYEDQDGVENSRENLSTMEKEEDQPYHHEKQEECQRVEVEDEKVFVVEVEDEKDVIVEVEDEKDIVIVGEDDHDQPPNYMKEDNIVDFGDHIESSSTNLDANEEKKVSSFDELNAQHQNKEHDHLNVNEPQENERKHEEDMKEVIKIEVEQEYPTVKEPAKEPTIVTQANLEQNETKVSTNKRLIVNKKETAMAYNDVIEETRSKLLQDRKNKVKALVGAFETVMSIDKN